jgi:hypothetical protein
MLGDAFLILAGTNIVFLTFSAHAGDRQGNLIKLASSA